MLDIAPTELLVLGTVALLVIPPKDLPRAMRIAGQWVGRARGMARTFRSGFDDMIRESEFQEMERKWKAENERIMREFPPTPDQAALMAPHEPAPHEPASVEPLPQVEPTAPVVDMPVAEEPAIAPVKAAPKRRAKPAAGTTVTAPAPRKRVPAKSTARPRAKPAKP
ncbi:MAG: twin-arginine translocase subunit TatB [Sphingomonas sp.]|uniref:Sec-independent protein translocase protein TatB n=1 Tax=Sphingomonas sp. TaxID=28214 RepID=UPI001AD594EF|nr:Sec-independent protein translocase protein TatB [Sphingomonas sp.]MBN8808362.1 twin-arginine translocase subunit TatB [Sphingomonas sp.]